MSIYLTRPEERALHEFFEAGEVPESLTGLARALRKKAERKEASDAEGNQDHTRIQGS